MTAEMGLGDVISVGGIPSPGESADSIGPYCSVLCLASKGWRHRGRGR